MKQRFFITLATGAVALSTLLASAPAQASSLTSAQVQAIVGLVESFGADQSVINNVKSSLGDTTASPVTSGSSCVSLTSTLTFGSKDSTTGGQVSKLQAYLGGTVNGSFGPATQKLVQQWQASHNIVSSGSPSTTGYGSVGAKTRVAMACGSKTSGSATSSSVPNVVLLNPNLGPRGGVYRPPYFAPTTNAPTTGGATASSSANVTGSIDKIATAPATTQTTITGKVQGASTVVVSISKLGQKIYDSAPLSTTGGVWSVSIPASVLTSGIYAVTVFEGSSTRVLARGTMTITSQGN